MGLLNPLLLLLGIAAAVPLLLHLLQRQQGPRVVFPALRYLRRAEKESARRIRVRQILLMMLRIAAVLLVAFAAARPYLRLGGAGHSPTAVAIVLDNSMSSAVVADEVRLLDEFRSRALEVLADAGPDDVFWLFRAGSPEEPALAGDAGATALRIRETEPALGAADIPATLQRARAVLAAGAEGRATEIHVLTDLQASSFPAAAGGASTDGTAGRGGADAASPPVVLWHPGSEPPPNRWVADVEVGGGLSPIAGERTTVAAHIAGSGTDPAAVRLVVNDRLVAAATAPPGATAVLSLPPQPPGFLAGRIDIDADALRADDARYFVARVLPPPTVGIAGELPFVDDALEVLLEAGRVRRGPASTADVAIVDGSDGAATPTRGALVMLPPATPTGIAAANRRLAAAGIPWRFDAPGAGEARFGPADGDPLLRSLETARLRQVYPLVAEGAGASDSVVLRLSDGAPWAVRGERRTGGIYVVLASPLSDEASTIPTSAAMLPLLDRLTGPWTLPEPPRYDVAFGTDVSVPSAATTLERPDGSREPVSAGATLAAGPDPGVYRLLRGDSVVAAFAVNAARDASDLARLDRRTLQARLPGWSLHVTTEAGAWRRAAFRERLGHELWRPLLLALLVVLILETVVAAAGRTRRESVGVDPSVEPAGT